ALESLGFSASCRCAGTETGAEGATLTESGMNPATPLGLVRGCAAHRRGRRFRSAAQDADPMPGIADFLSGLLPACSAATYPIVSIEDGMAEDDWAGWTV